MKYILFICSTIFLSGCEELNRTTTEEYISRTEYCKSKGMKFYTEANGVGHVWVYCLSEDNRKLESKWEKE